MPFQTFGAPHPGGDDFYNIHISLPAVNLDKLLARQLGSLLDNPRAFEEAVTWYLQESNAEANQHIAVKRNEVLCDVLCSLQSPFIADGQVDLLNLEHAHLLLVSSCSVIHHFSATTQIVDPFPSKVYDLLGSVLKLASVYDREYRADPRSLRHLEQGFSFLSEALSLDSDIGRWVPNSNKQPTRKMIIQFLDAAFGYAVEGEMPDYLPEVNTFLELRLLNEEIKIAGALRLFELSENLPILMRRVICWQREIDQLRASDAESWVQEDTRYDYGLEGTPWVEQGGALESDPNYSFIESEILGSLIDSYGRIVSGADGKSNRDMLIDDRDNIYSLLVSHQPDWPAWSLCLRSYLKLSNESLSSARELLQDSLIETILSGKTNPEALRRFIANDWEAEELLCHVVKALPKKEFEDFRAVIQQSDSVLIGDRGNSLSLADRIQLIYLRRKESYFSRGFGL